MFVDIHTHQGTNSVFPTVQNLTFNEALIVFESVETGFFSVGFHPWHIDDFSDERLSKIRMWGSDSRFVALGECGLDKNSTHSFESQLFVFEKQIELSEGIKKPLIIHCVGFFNQLFELKKKLRPEQLWIIHGFRGKPELAKQALNAGCALSFGEHFNPESVQITPLNKLFVETDESKLSIFEIYHQIALNKNVDEDELIAGKLFFSKNET